MKNILIILFSITLSLGTFAQELPNAVDAYATGDYAEAARLYEQELNNGVSAEVYYNLGNAYYKMDKFPSAILNYERALLLAPGNSDIRFNLELAKTKITDKIEPVEKFFLIEWFNDMQNLQSSDGWAKLGIILFISFICCAFLFFFGRFSFLRKIAFYGGIALFVCTIFANIFANNQKNVFSQKEYAIVFGPSITVKSSPNLSGTDLFVIHEGLKVRVKNVVNDWSEIELEDGHVGWISSSLLEKI